MALGPSVYKLIFDTQGLNNVTASRREIALQKKIMEETRPAVERYGESVAVLDRMHAKGILSTADRSAALSQLRLEKLAGIPVIGRYSSMLASVGPVGVTVAAAVGGAAIAVRNLHVQYEKMDTLLQKSRNVGIAADQFQRMEFAANLADIEVGEFASGMEKMLVGISKADSEPGGKIGKVFKLAKLDADALKAMRPEEAFKNITAAIGEMTNVADRNRAATAIFGSADWVRMDPKNIETAIEHFTRLGATITGGAIVQFEELDLATDKLGKAWDLMWQNFSQGSSGAQTSLKNFVTGTIDVVNTIGRKISEDIQEVRTGVHPSSPQYKSGMSQHEQILRDYEASEAKRKAAMPKDLSEDEIENIDKQRWDEQARERERFSDFEKQLEKDLADTRKILWDENVAEFHKEDEADFKRQVAAEEKADRALKTRSDAIKNMEKELRQSGMTPGEQSVDDFKALEGVDAAEVAIYETLQKELDLREKIRDVVQATSGVLKVGTREAADAMARASQSAMIAPQASQESLKLQRKAVELAQKLIDKTVPLVIEEVTL